MNAIRTISRGWRLPIHSGPRLALLIILFAAHPASADPLGDTLTYDSLGTVGTEHGVGAGPIGFQSVAFGSISFESAAASSAPVPELVRLGDIVVPPLAQGETLTYNQTPFSILFEYDLLGPQYLKAFDLVEIHGTLTGTIDAQGHSSMVANFGPVESLGQTSPVANGLIQYASPVLIGAPAAGSTDSVSTPLFAVFTDPPTPVPEPACTSAAVLAVGLFGHLIRSRFARRTGRRHRQYRFVA